MSARKSSLKSGNPSKWRTHSQPTGAHRRTPRARSFSRAIPKTSADLLTGVNCEGLTTSPPRVISRKSRRCRSSAPTMKPSRNTRCCKGMAPSSGDGGHRREIGPDIDHVGDGHQRDADPKARDVGALLDQTRQTRTANKRQASAGLLYHEGQWKQGWAVHNKR